MMSNDKSGDSIEFSSDLAGKLTLQLVQHAKVWGADEDLMLVMDQLQSELEAAGRNDVTEEAARQLGEIMGRMVSANVADADYAILDRHFYFLPGEKDRAGCMPGFSVMGPVESASSVVKDAEIEMVNVEGTAMQRVSVRSLIRIDQEAYELMVDLGLLTNPERPFEIVMHSGNWQSEIRSDNEFRLL